MIFGSITIIAFLWTKLALVIVNDLTAFSTEEVIIALATQKQATRSMFCLALASFGYAYYFEF